MKTTITISTNQLICRHGRTAADTAYVEMSCADDDETRIGQLLGQALRRIADPDQALTCWLYAFAELDWDENDDSFGRPGTRRHAAGLALVNAYRAYLDEVALELTGPVSDDEFEELM